MKFKTHLNFIIQYFLRDIKNKYSGSFFGLSWSIISPLIMIALYAVIFSNVLTLKLGINDSVFNYVNYLCIGIIAWNLLAEFINQTLNIFRLNSNLIKKLNIFKIHLLISSMLSSLFNFFIILSIFFIYLLITQQNILNINILLFVFVVCIQIIFIFSLGLFLSSLNIFLPDVEHFFKIFLQLWFWMSPIVYPITIIPEFLKIVLSLNPFFYFLKYYQDIFVYKTISGIFTLELIVMFFINFIFLLFSLFFYNTIKKHIVDEV